MLRVRTVATGVAGTPWYINMHFSGVGQSAAQAASGAVTNFFDACKAFLSNAVTFTPEDLVAEIDPVTGQPTAFYAVAVDDVVGTNSNSIIPPAIQVSLALGTNGVQNGRRVRGHIYLPGTTEDVWSGGLVDAGLRDDFEAAVTPMFDIDTGTSGLVVYSRAAQGSFAAETVECVPKGAVLRSRRD